MYIPRIIHYCWFGGEMPLEIKKRIKSWRKALPEYEFVLWTEENFDVKDKLISEYFVSVP